MPGTVARSARCTRLPALKGHHSHCRCALADMRVWAEVELVGLTAEPGAAGRRLLVHAATYMLEPRPALSMFWGSSEVPAPTKAHISSLPKDPASDEGGLIREAVGRAGGACCWRWSRWDVMRVHCCFRWPLDAPPHPSPTSRAKLRPQGVFSSEKNSCPAPPLYRSYLMWPERVSIHIPALPQASLCHNVFQLAKRQ